MAQNYTTTAEYLYEIYWRLKFAAKLDIELRYQSFFTIMHNMFEYNVEAQAMRPISLIFKLCTKKFLRLKRQAKIEDHFMLITLITSKAINVCKDTLSLLIDKNIG